MRIVAIILGALCVLMGVYGPVLFKAPADIWSQIGVTRTFMIGAVVAGLARYSWRHWGKAPSRDVLRMRQMAVLIPILFGGYLTTVEGLPPEAFRTAVFPLIGVILIAWASNYSKTPFS